MSINANTVYVISYFAPQGSYAYDQNFAWGNVNTPPLSISTNSPGVYAYGSSSSFPTNTWNASNYWVDVVFNPAPPLPPVSLWPSTAIPGTASQADTGSVEVGLQFSSSVAGWVTGVRFYKGPNNTGAHTGHLWTSNGTLLASVTFTAETASGWKQANFPTPVQITANTPYVISYFAPNGGYADDQNFDWSTLSAPPLSASGVSPGVYAYGATPSFPVNIWNVSNYWVDVVFTPIQ